MKPRTVHTLKSLLADLKFDAYKAGRYVPPYTAKAFDKRNKKEAFFCIAYNRCLRQINALIDAIKELEGRKT